MKKLVRFIVTFVFIGYLAANSLNVNAQASLVSDSVLLGASYANEVYYSMANGQIAAVPRDQWDIAFRTNIMSSSIIINDGTGVILYSYPKADTTGWASVDTSGLSGWTPMFNGLDDWENGAFGRNATGHPDYGWGVYNSTTHNLKGDSIFIIKLRNESYRKIWIVRKYSSLNTYVFKFAYLDGSDEHEITLDCNPYATKDFVGYNLAMNVVVDYQPAKSDWDLLFTKYMSIQPDGTPYPVTGVLSSSDIGVGKHAHVGPTFSDWGTEGFDAGRTVIGYDWKVFDMTNFVYICKDSLVYFVLNQPGDVYELRFTKFAGSSSGKVVFGKNKVSLAGINPSVNQQPSISVYPNPVSDLLSIELKNQASSVVNLSITNLLGQKVFERNLNDAMGMINLSIPVNNWNTGMYIVNLNSGSFSVSRKLIVK